MRRHKWKMLAAAMRLPEVTSREFSIATGLPPPQCSPYAHVLETDGYLKLIREVPPERGGRPIKYYAWTGKKPPRSIGGSASQVVDSMWGQADPTLINCFTAMVRCKERGDVSMECAMQ